MKTLYTRRHFLRILGAGAAAVSLPGCAGSLSLKTGSLKNRPNIILIFCDDQGYADVGCFGAKGFETPNLDKMADEGMRFTDFYAAAPTCTPSRAAIMTGCYPQRVGLEQVIGPHSQKGLNPDETTIAEVLKSRGYATACIGKWHLGDHAKFLPTNHGFDEYFGIPYSNDMWPFHPTDSKKYGPLPLMEGQSVVEYNPAMSGLTTRYTERSLKFIEKNKNSPFFLYLAHTMPHVPLGVSDKFKGKSEQGLYGDVIMEIDWSAGEIMSKLKQLGIDENTIIIFTSDNGPWLSYGNHGGSARPLRDGKKTTFDGGVRVPCIMRWPGKIPAGTTCKEITATMDILPTVAKLTGAKLPAKKMDGKDIWPLMSGQPAAKSPHEGFYYYCDWDLHAVRCGKWKLQLPHKYHNLVEIGNDGMPGKYESKDAGLALYDLEKDIAEQYDVSSKYPEVVDKLIKLADNMRQDLGDNLKNITGKGRRPAGEISEVFRSDDK